MMNQSFNGQEVRPDGQQSKLAFLRRFPTGLLPHQSKRTSDDHTDHSHSHSYQTNLELDGRLKLVILLSLGLAAIELVFGLMAHSLALVADAGHNFNDALILLFNWLAVLLMRLNPDSSRTYGYHRVGVLAAAVSALGLGYAAFLIFSEAVYDLAHPHVVQGWLTIPVALLALLINLVLTLTLAKYAHADLNAHSAYVHLAADVAGSAGVLLSGLVIIFTGWYWLDAVVSILIGAFIIWVGVDILLEALNILLEGSPSNLNFGQLWQDLEAVPGVTSIHDLHVWDVGGNLRVMSCHVETAQTSLEEGQLLIKRLNELVQHKYKVQHSTLQLEAARCEHNGSFCSRFKLEGKPD